MTGSLAIIFLLLACAAAVAGTARFVGRPLPRPVLAGFLLLAVLPYPRAFVERVTPLPLDHAAYVRPWYVAGSPAPRNPYLNDIATQILPWAEATRLAWKDGALPLRDRWNGCGTPLAANGVSAAFSPLTFLTLALPLWQGFTLAIAIRLLLAACGMWLWTRELGASAGASCFAGVAFALSFTFVPPWILYPQSSVFCLWPWTLFLLERCRDDRGRGRAIAALTGVFVLTALAGHPESAVMGFLFAALWLGARALSGDLPGWAHVARAIALGAAIGAGLTAFLLIPTLFAIAASARLAAVAHPYWEPLLSLAPHWPQWRGMIPAFFPHALGNGGSSPTIPGGTGTFCEMAMGYTGIVGWAAALLALRPGSPRPRSERVLWALLLSGFGVAVCAWPLAEIFAHVPVIRYVFPLRFNGWVALAAPAIAALELDRYAKDLREGRARPTAAVFIPAVLGLCALSLYLFARAVHAAAGGQPFQRQQTVAILAVLGLVALLALGTRSRPGVYVAGLTVLCGGELLFQWHGLNRVYPPGLLFPETPLLRFLHGQPGTFRVVGEGPAIFPSTNVFARLEDIRTHDAVERLDYLKFLDATCGYPYPDYFKKIRDVDAPAMDFLNVRYVIGSPQSRPPGDRWRPVYAGADGAVFENSRVLPRAFAPDRVRFVPPPSRRAGAVLDAAAAFGGVFAEITATQNWRETAYLLSAGGPARANPAVEIGDYSESTNAASLSVRVPDGAVTGVVVLSLVQDGGWSARDAAGAPVAVCLANGPFLALELPPGTHRVTLRYSPPGFRLGAAISLATLAALLVFASSRAYGRRRAPPPMT